MTNVPELFGCMVFDDATMQARLPKDVYRAMKTAVRDNKRLDINVANVVATAMKNWALEKGATHYTHWFQPMTGITAEKHDSFISPIDSGKVIMDFSGKELVRGESDASSFPSGGLRATFEARGYTAWDPTSYAFIKDDTLCIPTAFCSYGGEALDKKTPLLRSMEAINRQAMRVLKLFGHEDVHSVKTTVGPEQEYFLISEEMYHRRPDLIYTGRTLFGAKPPKGQELDDHYFGSLKPRVSAYMKELDRELWKLGVLAKTKHNEAAPAQHELAPIFTTTNIATDHNQLTMELMKKIAQNHGLVCLLHEKPFAGVNGSGKHNNWSLSTDTGINLLEPGDTPHDNAQFLLFLCAVLRAVDEYQDLLRISVASAGNDHRLGAHEAPPAIISIFLGDELNAILDAIENDASYDAPEKVQMKIGVHVLPRFPKDSTDRNRTSPFAFTGNKFEFRSLGSSASVATPNIMLNTAVAEVLEDFADQLEQAPCFTTALHDLIRTTILNHKRILFNGNGYDEKNIRQLEERGLLNLRTTTDCLPYYLHEKNIRLFEKHGVFTESEIRSRYEIHLENYCKVLHIEALTMLDMVKRDILPAVSRYVKELCDTAISKRSFLSTLDCSFEEKAATQISSLSAEIVRKVEHLDQVVRGVRQSGDILADAVYYKDHIITAMNELRATVDETEVLVSTEYWPYPGYGELLFSVE